jgi:hypothetical protein
MKKSIFFIYLILPIHLFSQQIADSTFNPTILHPEYKKGKGPVVFIDEGHHNFHTKDGRYQSFAYLLERDGYQVEAYKAEFNISTLSKGRILVISNALNEINVEDWYLPTPSAFTDQEIDAVKQWVNEGGSLFLIADHMPMAGAAKELAAAFGFVFTNGFVFNTLSDGPDYFNLKDNTLIKSSITEGRDSSESVKQVVSFTGQGFMLPEEASPILLFGDAYINVIPDTAWVFDDDSSVRYSAKGYAQGAYEKYGKGRVVAFGEAAMFTAQLAGPNKVKVGMNSTFAGENYQLLLNIIHWLDGKLD